MKKFCLLICIAIALISCSSEESERTSHAILLQRVDFLPDNPHVKHWLFNEKGLLAEIRDVDNVLVESFGYDNQGNMIKNTMYVNGVPNSTIIVGYNSNNFITHINGNALSWDPIERKYFGVDGFNSYNCFIDSNFLMKEAHALYDDTIDQYHTDNYCGHNTAGNMTGYHSNATFNAGPNCSYSHDDTINPLRNAILSIARAKSLYDPHFLANSLTSVNNITFLGFFSEDPETSQYRYDFNSHNLPTKQHCDNYYSGVFERTYVSANYYYQGDVLP